MRILLTSCGLNPSLKELFLSSLEKDVAECKVLFVVTASNVEDDKEYVQWDRQALYDCGIKEGNLFNYDIGQQLPISDFDILYLTGGNTLYLIEQIRKYHFDCVIRKHIDDNKLYIGNSAGCIVLCPTIETSKAFDINIINLHDFSGLNIIDYQVVPHANLKKDYLEKIKGQCPKILALNDSEGFLIQQ